jgi:hypothetical protein
MRCSTIRYFLSEKLIQLLSLPEILDYHPSEIASLNA